jgi:hypothetical protein
MVQPDAVHLDHTKLAMLQSQRQKRDTNSSGK